MPVSHPKHHASDWRALIVSTVARVWPELLDGPQWIEAQVDTESAGNPAAVSPVRASGLLQLMPATARELGLWCACPASITSLAHRAVCPLIDPASNLDAGVRYLRLQYEHFPEIPDHLDRLFWSFAAYNGGRGYCNKALALARMDGVPRWHVWEVGRHFLGDRRCVVAGREPDERQIWNYVTRIQRKAAARLMEE